MNHNKLIQQEFTKQAHTYAANPSIADPDWAMRLVQAAQPSLQDRVLEVATGPRYVVLAFATITQEVVGVDLTVAPLAIAEQNRQERGATNIRFESADANQLPFDDESFDLAVCRLAMHHFAEPQQVFREMVRVCRPNGKVIIEDLISSEDSKRADYYNRWERLRDPPHVTALSLSQLISFYAEARLVMRWSISRANAVCRLLKSGYTITMPRQLLRKPKKCAKCLLEIRWRN